MVASAALSQYNTAVDLENTVIAQHHETERICPEKLETVAYSDQGLASSRKRDFTAVDHPEFVCPQAAGMRKQARCLTGAESLWATKVSCHSYNMTIIICL